MTMGKNRAGCGCAAFLVITMCALLSINERVEGAQTLEGTSWLLQEVKGMKVEVPTGERQPSITFNRAEKRATGYSGCNEFFGSYELKEDSLSFGPMGMTRRFCEGAVGDNELAFIQALRETRAWRIEKGLLLLLDGSSVLARLKAVPH